MNEPSFFILKKITLERPWLERVFRGKYIEYTLNDSPLFFLKYFKENGYGLPNIIVCRDIYEQEEIAVYLTKILNMFQKQSLKINLIQLGDEFGGKLFFELYEHPAVNKIIRNYCYPYECKEFPEKALDKIYFFPLGTLHFNEENSLPNFQERTFVWSFIGRRFFGREYELSFYKNIQPSHCHITDEFLSPDALGPKEYQYFLKNTKFVPTVCGCNPETFRFYEALEFGAIPLYVRQPYDEIYWSFLKVLFPELLEISSFQEAVNILSSITTYKSPEEWENYRISLYDRWQKIKASPLVKLENLGKS